MHFISVIKIIHSMKTSFHSGAKGHTLWPDPVCRPLLSAEAQGPQVGAPQGDSSRALTPALSRGTEATATPGPGSAQTTSGTRCPQDRGWRAGQQRGKRVQAVSPGCPGQAPPPAPAGGRLSAEEPRREARRGRCPVSGAACGA